MKKYEATFGKLIVPEAALMAVFDECDRFDRDETGGRIVGELEEAEGKIALRITGVIEPGPHAKRSPVFLQQDGEYQESVFRTIETNHPEIEHLGTWHTHHVNGLQTLSGGDLATYRRTVDHPKHNIPFFYALLVVAKHKSKDPLRRYSVKHYLFSRGDEHVYEIPPAMVEIVSAPLVWPMMDRRDAREQRHKRQSGSTVKPGSVDHAYKGSTSAVQQSGARIDRVNDRDAIAELFPDIHPYSSPTLGIYWRGPLELLNGSHVEVVIVEGSSERPTFSIVVRQPPKLLAHTAEELAQRDFASACAALIAAERSCNRALFGKRGHRK